MMLMDKALKKFDIQAWIIQVSEQHLPILRATLHSLAAVVDDENSSTMRMTQAILQDAALTARVLRAANSSFYNQTGRPVSTVSRSLVLLGTDLLKSIAVSIAIMDTVVCAELRDRAMQLASRSFHAAAQARALAIARGDGPAEEAFIAALLLSIGELAFWCFSGGLGLTVDKALKQGRTLSQVENELIGCSFQRLSAELAREWKLNPTLIEALRNPRSRHAGVQSVYQGHAIANLAEEKGWETRELQIIIAELAKELRKEPHEIQNALEENAKTAQEMLRLQGFTAPLSAEAGLPEDTSQPEPAPEQRWQMPDPMLQLRVLRELTQVFGDDSPLQVVLEMVLEGMFRGIGLDRVMFAVLAADKQALQIRYMLDIHNAGACIGHKIHLRSGSELQAMLGQAVCSWEQHPSREAADAWGFPAGAAPLRGFMLGPAIIRGQTIGTFYGDREASGRSLDQESFEAFRVFVQQARLGLEFKQQRRNT